MKTAISIPDQVFQAADTLAAKLGISRSHLYATAVEEYLAKHKGEAITQRLNAVYGDQPGRLDPAVRTAQAQSVGPGEW